MWKEVECLRLCVCLWFCVCVYLCACVCLCPWVSVCLFVSVYVSVSRRKLPAWTILPMYKTRRLILLQSLFEEFFQGKKLAKETRARSCKQFQESLTNSLSIDLSINSKTSAVFFFCFFFLFLFFTSLGLIYNSFNQQLCSFQHVGFNVARLNIQIGSSILWHKRRTEHCALQVLPTCQQMISSLMAKFI